MSDTFYFFFIWAVGLGSGVALTLAWEARRITNEATRRLENTKGSSRCPLGATTHSLMLQKRGKCPGCEASVRVGAGESR